MNSNLTEYGYFGFLREIIRIESERESNNDIGRNSFSSRNTSYNFRIYGTLTFHGNANIVRRHGAQLQNRILFSTDTLPLWWESEAFVEILLPNWPFRISKNIDSANGRGEKSFVQSTHRDLAMGFQIQISLQSN